MTSHAPSALSRMLREHRIIWWIFAASLLLAWLGSLPARSAFGSILDHSLASDRLVHGFDLGTFTELLNSPEIPAGALFAASAAQMAVFFLFLLFLAGGINAAYDSRIPLDTGAFFQACGAHFWRMARLTLVSLIPFALLAAGFGILDGTVDRLGESPSERLPDYVRWAGLAVLGLLLLWVRAWFDLAQARTVAWGERGMFKTALRTFRQVNLRLYGAYLALGLLRLVLTAAAIWLWMRLAPESTWKALLAMESIVLIHIVTRLWQRAASVRALEGMA